MKRVALAIAYDGTAFDSYARQPGRRTVEGEVLRLLEGAGIIESPAAARFRSGSRTDRGVSASWNVVAFDTDATPGQTLAAGARAPPGLVFLSAVRAEASFNPRHASRRTYAYLVPADWGFDWGKVRSLAKEFVGEHDVTNFSRPEPHRNPRREITRIRYVRTRGPPRLEYVAPSFAWQEVRRITAALRAVSAGRFHPDAVRRALREPRERVDLGIAPAEHLVLLRVDYQGLDFPRLARASRARLEATRAAAVQAAFVYGAAVERTPSRRR